MNLILRLLNGMFEREGAYGENTSYKNKQKKKEKINPLSFVKMERRRHSVGCIYFFLIWSYILWSMLGGSILSMFWFSRGTKSLNCPEYWHLTFVSKAFLNQHKVFTLNNMLHVLSKICFYQFWWLGGIQSMGHSEMDQNDD